MLNKSTRIIILNSLLIVSIFIKCTSKHDFSHQINKAKSYEKQKEDSALLIYNKILPKVKDSVVKAKVYYRIAYTHYFHDKYEPSIKYFDRAEKALFGIDIQKSYPVLKNVYTFKGYALKSMSRMPEAVSVFNKNLKLAQIQKDSVLIAETIRDIGSVHFKNHLHDKALEYYKDAKEIAKIIKDTSIIQRCLGSIAIIHAERKQYDKAIPVFLEEREYFRKIKSMSDVANITANIGMCYMYKGELDKGIEYIMEANRYFEKNKMYSGITRTYRNLAYFHEMKNDYDKSMEYYKIARNLCRKHNVKQVLGNVLGRMSRLSEKHNNYKDAHKYYRDYYLFRDSLKIKKSQQEIANIELKFKQDRKIDKIKQKEEATRIYILLGSVIIILSMTIVIIMVRRRLKLHKEKLQHEKEKKRHLKVELENADLRQKHLDSELSRKRQEVLDFSFHLQDKNRLLEELEQELVLLKNSNKLNVSSMTTIRNSLKNHLQRNNEFTELNDKLQNINAEYFDIIKEKHPDVTKDELNLMGLIKLNISTKQISVIYNTTEKSVESRRYRLRKKLKLEKNENLTEYLNNINN